MHSPTKASLPKLHQAQQKQVQRNCQEITKASPQQEVHQRDWIERLHFCAIVHIGRRRETAALLTSFMNEQSTLATNT